MAITHAPLVLAMIIPKPLRRFIFPLMLHYNAQQPPWKTQCLCNWLLVECETADPSSIFYYLISSQIDSFHRKLIFLPKPSSAENPNLQYPWRFPPPPAPTPSAILLPLLLPHLLQTSLPPPSTPFLRVGNRRQSTTRRRRTRPSLLCTG